MNRLTAGLLLWACLVPGCSDPPAPARDIGAPDRAPLGADARDRDSGREAGTDVMPDVAAPDVTPAPCPAGMVHVATFCIDPYEAPNNPGAQPLVMYTFVEAAAWCQARGKRLCFDDEWTLACAGPGGLSYPYGNAHQPGVCNDDKTWKVYSQSKLNGWPPSASGPTVGSLQDLLAAARAVSPTAKAAADHVEALYQAEPPGAGQGCRNSQHPVFDLCGNVEEWTRRRDGGEPQFHGSLKGRYWAEPRTCQSAVTTHGDGFRFYEIGFRCCRDPL